MKQTNATAMPRIAGLLLLGLANPATAHDPRLTEITGLPEQAIYAVQQRVLFDDEGQFELLYYANRASAAAIAAAPNRICRYVGAHLVSSEEVPTAAILQQNLPEVRKVVVRCD